MCEEYERTKYRRDTQDAKEDSKSGFHGFGPSIKERTERASSALLLALRSLFEFDTVARRYRLSDRIVTVDAIALRPSVTLNIEHTEQT